MVRHAAAKTGETRTRRAILERLKQHGAQAADELAEPLGVTGMAVRQHLYNLKRQKLVTYQQQHRRVGRPAKLWKLTAEADRYFPDGHAELTVGLLGAIGKTFGSEGLEKLLFLRAKQQIAAYRKRVPRRASLRRRLEALARIRTEEGYMADVLQEDGELLLVENHCPICAAATACTGLCGAELEVFQQVLGREIEITRTEHIVSGARRCAYRMRRRKQMRSRADG